MTYRLLSGTAGLKLELHQTSQRVEISGICPYNPSIFSETDFAPSSVTDRPEPETSAQAHATADVAASQDPCPVSVLPPISSNDDQLCFPAAVVEVTLPN